MVCVVLVGLNEVSFVGEEVLLLFLLLFKEVKDVVRMMVFCCVLINLRYIRSLIRKVVSVNWVIGCDIRCMSVNGVSVYRMYVDLKVLVNLNIVIFFLFVV